MRVPRGFFTKTLLGREWDRVPQKESEPAIGARLFRRDEVLSRNAHRPSGFAFTNLKKFLRVPRGVFSKTRPWQGVGQGPTKGERASPSGCPFSGGTKSFHETPQIFRLRLHEPKKVFGGSKGRFFKNAPWQGVGQGPTKREGEPAIGVRLFRRDEVPARNTNRPFGFAFKNLKKFLRVPRGVFSKTRPWQGVGQGPTKGERASHRGAPFQAGQGPFTKRPQTVRLCLYKPKKVFEGSKGRFFKNAPWQGVGQGPTERKFKPVRQGAPFQAGRSPFTKRPQTVRLCLYKPKKVFEGSKGRFFKNAPLAGCGTGSHKKRGRASHRGAPFQAGQSPGTKHPRLSSLAFTNLKKFLRVPRGVFSKTHLGREWDRVPQKERASQPIGARLFRRDKVPARNTHKIVRLGLHTPRKVFEGSKGRFFKNAPLAGCGTGSHKKRGRASSAGCAFSGGTKSLHETPTDCPAWPSRTQKSF